MLVYKCDCCRKEIENEDCDLYVLDVGFPRGALFTESFSFPRSLHLCSNCMNELEEYLRRCRNGWKVRYEKPVAPETETITESDVDISKEV